MRSIRDVKDLAGKTVLMRVDFNVEIAEDALKLEKSLPTITYLLEQKVKLVLMSHRSRPAGRVVPEFSLDFALPFLREKASAQVALLPDFNFPKIKQQVAAAPAGSLFVLENIRFAPGEETDDAEFAKGLASIADIYVNDAFASDHHPSVSVSGVAKLLPSYAGFLVEDEVKHLSRALTDAQQPLIVIIGGGAKAGEKFAVIRNLYDRTAMFLIGGVMANTFLKARGVDMGTSQIDETITADVAKYLNDPKIMLPTDFVFDEKKKALDLGPASSKKYAEVIATAKTVIWNGTMGMFEVPKYRAGSLVIAQAIASSGAFSVVGGGETTQFLLEEKMADKFSFLSTGGGAMLAYLAGKPMPGLDALN